MENLTINAKYFIQVSENSKGLPTATLFQNTPKARYNTKKAVVSYYFRTENERFDWVLKQVNKIHENDRQAIERKVATKEATKANAQKGTVKVGTIFYASWGYDQTNVDFYEVTEIKGTMATIRALCQKDAESGMTTAIPGKYYGQEMRKKISFKYESPSISLTSYSSAYLWNGKPKYYSSGH